jgi:hypothetical protein
MPSFDQHTTQAEHNKELLAFIWQHNKQAHFSDWCVTIAFYAALHYFEAALFVVKPITHGEHCSNHTQRNDLIKTGYGQLYLPYISLYKMSRAARYNCNASNSYSWARTEIFLENVKQECGKLILCTAKQ